MAQFGRHPDEIKIMPGLTVYVGRTRGEAEARYAEMKALIHPLVGLSLLCNLMGDLTGLPLDGPVPEPTDPRVRSMAEGLLGMARREGLSIRGLYKRIAAGNGGRVLVGTPHEIADDMEAWFRNGAADGFNICPSIFREGLRSSRNRSFRSYKHAACSDRPTRAAPCGRILT